MLNENKISLKPFIALIIINILYLVLVITDSVEGIFVIWLFFIFLSALPFILKDRKYTIAILAFLIPLEISKMLIPFFQTVETSDGMFNSVFDLARLFMLYSFIVWFITDLKNFVLILNHKISFILVIFIAYYFLSTIFLSPDMGKGMTETLRYTIYFLMFTMTAQFIKKPDDITLVLKVLVVVAIILCLEGISEYIFDYRLWIDKGRRASATFLDPNIFARFLDIIIVALLILRLKKHYIIKPQYIDISLLLCVITLLLTVSRQGLVILFAGIIFMSLFLPTRQRIFIFIGIGVAALIAIPVFMQLMAVRQQGMAFYDIGQRAGLLLGGVLMFLGSPIYGVGAGGFQMVMINNYNNLLPWGAAGDTLSHTYIVTILAEQGLIGIILFSFLLYYIYKQFKFNFASINENIKTYAVIILTAIVIIFIGAQAEGRFFEEPFLWLFIGLGVALERMNKEKYEIKKK